MKAIELKVSDTETADKAALSGLTTGKENEAHEVQWKLAVQQHVGQERKYRLDMPKCVQAALP